MEGVAEARPSIKITNVLFGCFCTVPGTWHDAAEFFSGKIHAIAVSACKLF